MKSDLKTAWKGFGKHPYKKGLTGITNSISAYPTGALSKSHASHIMDTSQEIKKNKKHPPIFLWQWIERNIHHCKAETPVNLYYAHAQCNSG